MKQPKQQHGAAAGQSADPGMVNQLLLAAKCALADLEGLTFGIIDPEADEPAALTIRELRAAISRAEGGGR